MKVPGKPRFATKCPDPRSALELAANNDYVAIGGHFMAEKHLEAGILVSPIPHALVFESRVVLICSKGQEVSDRILWLRNALHASADKDRRRVKDFELFDYDGNTVPSLV